MCNEGRMSDEDMHAAVLTKHFYHLHSSQKRDHAQLMVYQGYERMITILTPQIMTERS